MKSSTTEPAVILIIDSDPVMLTGIAAILNMSGYECHCARDRVAATKAVRTLALDLIVCDVQLRSESGLDLAHDLRGISGAEDVPVMFLSSAQAPDIVRRAHDAGGAYYLRKPFDPEVLIELVGKALWMPHLIQTRVARMQSYPHAAIQPPKMSRIREAIQGIKMPLA